MVLALCLVFTACGNSAKPVETTTQPTVTTTDDTQQTGGTTEGETTEVTTEETTEEETEAEAPMEEPVELFLWINGDIYALAEEQNLTVEWSVSERLVAQNDALRVSSKPNSTEIPMP